MTKLLKEIFFVQILFFLIGCTGENASADASSTTFAQSDGPIVGAEQMPALTKMLDGKRVGVVINQSSLVNSVHLVDTLQSAGVNLKKIFAPEHGYRGKAEAGELVDNTRDAKSNLPVFSLYGKNKKVPPGYFLELDAIVFDLQDVGTRFYTYISTLHYVMEAAAREKIPVYVLDRPNPNGHYVDGPIKRDGLQAFVAMHKVPIVHGMTIGEYAKMVNGEKWLKDGIQCELQVIKVKNYSRDMTYELPIRPSPNLPNLKSILLYPSLCLFEGTVISVGRGTQTPFQVYGHPKLSSGSHTFTPQPKAGGWPPKLSQKECKGKSFTDQSIEALRKKKFTLQHIIDAYNEYPDKEKFFLASGYFDTLAGNTEVRKMIIAGKSEKEIRASWQDDLVAFKKVRSKYLLYP